MRGSGWPQKRAILEIRDPFSTVPVTDDELSDFGPHMRTNFVGGSISIGVGGVRFMMYGVSGTRGGEKYAVGRVSVLRLK